MPDEETSTNFNFQKFDNNKPIYDDYRKYMSDLDHGAANLMKSHKFRGTRIGANYDQTLFSETARTCASHLEGSKQSFSKYKHTHYLDKQNVIMAERKDLMHYLSKFYRENTTGVTQLREAIINKYIELKSKNEKIRIKSTSMEGEVNIFSFDLCGKNF
jgi:hypothetical protein